MWKLSPLSRNGWRPISKSTHETNIYIPYVYKITNEVSFRRHRRMNATYWKSMAEWLLGRLKIVENRKLSVERKGKLFIFRARMSIQASFESRKTRCEILAPKKNPRSERSHWYLYSELASTQKSTQTTTGGKAWEIKG